jgi:hypothetical protein
MAEPTLKDLQASIGLVLASVNKMEKKLDEFAALQSQVNILVKDVDSLKSTVNNLDQESRCCTIRVVGLSVPEADIKQHGQDKAIMKRAYDKIIKPILTIAKNKGDIDAVPMLLNVLENGRFVGKSYVDQQGRSLPPPFTVTFINRYVRNVVMRLKKDHIPNPSDAEKAAGSSRYSISEDLTSLNSRRLKEYRDNESVHRAWTVDGRIRFVLATSNEVVRKAPSPFITAADAISKIK